MEGLVLYAIKTFLFVAEVQETHGVCSAGDCSLDRYPSVRDTVGMFHVGHRRQCVHTVGRLQQRRCGENGAVSHRVRRILPAADADDLLLLSH